MKVCVGSLGAFHAHDLARQTHRRDSLERLYTGYPRSRVDGVPSSRVQSFPWIFAPLMLARRAGLRGFERSLDRLSIRSFDEFMARNLVPCDIFHALSAFATESHRVAKARHGAMTMCDRASSHILHQDHVMREEFENQGNPYTGIDPWIIDRELSEYEFCDLIIVPSEFVRRSFVQKGVSAHKVRKNPFGVDLRMFKPVVKEDAVFRVIYVGTLGLRKGLPYLLEAAASFKAPHFECWLIGPVLPEAKPLLRKYEGAYKYMGVVPRPELHRYYSQGSVFVLASIEEGLACVQAQAMACGLPVIATVNTGAEDLFTDGVEGFIVPIKSAEAIREKIEYLYSNREDRDRMANAALNRVHSLGGWDTYGDRTLAIYELALAGRPSEGRLSA